MPTQIIYRTDGTVLLTAEAASVRDAILLADLTGADLRGADLTCADLRSANLTGADLTGASLTRANLTGASLRSANLTGADLTGASLTRANLTGADLNDANLTRANLYRASLRGASLRGASLTCADLRSANLTGADLTCADLRGADLTCADLTRANLTGASLTRANLTGADLTRANLTGADLTRVSGSDPARGVPLLMLLDQPGAIRAYKLVTASGDSPMQSLSKLHYAQGATLEVSDANCDPSVDCAAGINVATLDWCLREWETGYRILLVEFTAADIACIPTATDGKFRLHRCTVVGEKDLAQFGLGTVAS
jgi:hypothetical protein